MLRHITLGITSLLHAIPILITNPSTLVFASFRLPLVALWVYFVSSFIWMLIYIPVVSISAITGFDIATKHTTLRSLSVLVGLLAQFISPRIATTSGIWDKVLHTSMTNEKYLEFKSKPILRPLSGMLFNLLKKLFLAALIVGVVIPILLVTAPMTILGGTVAVVPGIAAVIVVLIVSVLSGGGAIFWKNVGKPIVVLVNTLNSVRNVMILVIGLLMLSLASHSGWTFIEMFMIVIDIASTFHFSILLSESLFAQVVIRTKKKNWNKWKENHRFLLFGFGLLPYLCFQYFPLFALAGFECFQGGAAVLLATLLVNEREEDLLFPPTEEER